LEAKIARFQWVKLELPFKKKCQGRNKKNKPFSLFSGQPRKEEEFGNKIW